MLPGNTRLAGKSRISPRPVFGRKSLGGQKVRWLSFALISRDSRAASSALSAVFAVKNCWYVRTVICQP